MSYVIGVSVCVREGVFILGVYLIKSQRVHLLTNAVLEIVRVRHRCVSLCMCEIVHYYPINAHL